MKRIIYSSALKFFAILLFIASIVLGVLTLANGVMRFLDEENDIYGFERDFSESWYLSYLLQEPENILYNVYFGTFRPYDQDGKPVDQENVDFSDRAEELEQNLKESFEAFDDFDKINYYVKWNDLVFTNCGATSAGELMKGEYNSYLKRDSSGNIERSSFDDRVSTPGYRLGAIERFDRESTIIIACNINEEIAEEYRAIWERQEKIVKDTFFCVLLCILAAALLLIYLISVCGRNAAGEYGNTWLDNVWIEVHFAAMAGASIGVVALCIVVLDEFASGPIPRYWIGTALSTATALGSLIIIVSLLSVIRNIKTCRFTKKCIILRTAIWIVQLLIKISRWAFSITKRFWSALFKGISGKTGAILIAMLFVYTAMIGLFGILTEKSSVWLAFGILFFGAACFVVACRARDLAEIKKSVGEIRKGNVSYQIPEPKCSDMKLLAADLNDIAVGLDESVAAKVKAERLKSELITNVSHDLKTPITSIISYTELLKKIDRLPEEAKDYVEVIAKKGERLKNLTQDLFDISKVQSGNEDVFSEKLNVALLIQQALGEHDSEIRNSGLTFRVEIPAELCVFADGRKMSRVLSNLINNILKYAMKNTRVFMTASEKNGNVEIEFKNVSAYPLDFNAEEITQRFVRGDESRTAEGNGLGLAIAKSYTEICGGAFEVSIDGDLFKAVLKFKRIY